MQRRSVDMLEAFMPYFGIAHSIKDQSGSLALSDFKLYEVPKEDKEASIDDIFAALKSVAKRNESNK
ncbi:hypothetical protein [Vibrio porteresiae]|uniref:Uncharacterized protein n=1 Tax=Vibrio porteresiae DSM 19223 TaxID=1123496 RepID=A0ABZ0Q945_9VIBR|nr:hypothetical protein [Vibrio porteresiae]WPC72919.1 hypothetical protein R8Z52_12370 [Vibrio porteresiae DSM 19223]